METTEGSRGKGLRQTREVQMESDEEREWKSKKLKKSKGEVMSDSDEVRQP